MRHALVWLAVAAALLPTPPALADVAFPARLEITETVSGAFEVIFTLPIVEGRKLRAVPLLPPACRDLTTRRVSASSAGHTLAWTAVCEPASLAGEAILVEGLLGTQTDLAFTLTTLDGRIYSEILRPSRPGFLVPEPPSNTELAGEAALAGIRRTLRQLPLWLLLAVAALLGSRMRALLAAVGLFAATHALGQWLGGNGWLQIALPQRDLFVFATVALPAVTLAGGGDRFRGWLQPLWPLAGLVGLLCGGASPEALSPAGLSNGEQLLAILFFAVGAGLGLLVMAAAAAELDAVLRLAAGATWRRRGSRWLGYAIGALATGLLLATVAALALPSARGAGTPIELALLATVLAPSLAAVGRTGALAVPAFAGLAGLGVAAGLAGLLLPWGGTVATGSLLLLGAALASGRTLPARWLIAAGALAVPAHAWLLTQTLVENVSRSTGVAVGAAVVATCVFYAGLGLSRGLWADALPVGVADLEIPRGVRFLGAAIAVLAIAARFAEYRVWLEGELATEVSLGIVRLPVLALILVTASLLLWPRRRRVIEELGLQRRRRSAHWILLGAAWLALPYGTVTLANPFFEPHAPRGEDARRVASRVLSDTYHAFNLTDENELYDRLAESVTGDLVDDLYLDSRRRLTAGTREGAEVTVRKVEVLDIGEPGGGEQGAPRGGVGGSGTFQAVAYDCRWVVTARVRHLQHVHHRRNVYAGVLTLRVDGERWKIAGVELHSEDREVVSWNPA